MWYTATVRRKNAPTVTMTKFRALDIREAAEIVRAKYGFDTDDPHRGFVINQSLPTSAKTGVGE